MRRRRVALAALFAVAIAPAAWADEEIDKLREGFEQAQRKFYDEVRALHDKGDREAGQKLYAARAHVKEFAPRFAAYAEKHAGKPEAIPALVWMVANPLEEPAPGKPSAGAQQALKTLTEKHAADAGIAAQFEALGAASWTCGDDAALAFFERVARENKDKEAVAGAKYNVGLIHYQYAEWPADDGKAKPDADERRKKAVDLFRAVAKEHAGTAGAAQAEPFIFELDRLQVGMTAPDFEGPGLDEKTIKLSQFRGKVVVIDFWGFW
ncbi:thiol-disulfide oxidoreductase [Phycisphaerae bacterium RAS1]|nr:thiol-disulfide oxidoreductase [Phycisphaerae bacterium RAS1]